MDDIKITLAAARVNAGLTQDDVAREMAVTKQTIVNWEKGRKVLKPAELEKLCRMYNMPIDIIFLPTVST